jgi:hypothetical protein
VKTNFGLINPISVESGEGFLTVEQANKKVTLAHQDIKAVRTEENSLVVETYTEPIYFKAPSEENANEAMAYILELVR